MARAHAQKAVEETLHQEKAIFREIIDDLHRETLHISGQFRMLIQRLNRETQLGKEEIKELEANPGYRVVQRPEMGRFMDDLVNLTKKKETISDRSVQSVLTVLKEAGLTTGEILKGEEPFNLDRYQIALTGEMKEIFLQRFADRDLDTFLKKYYTPENRQILFRKPILLAQPFQRPQSDVTFPPHTLEQFIFPDLSTSSSTLINELATVFKRLELPGLNHKSLQSSIPDGITFVAFRRGMPIKRVKVLADQHLSPTKGLKAPTLDRNSIPSVDVPADIISNGHPKQPRTNRHLCALAFLNGFLVKEGPLKVRDHHTNRLSDLPKIREHNRRREIVTVAELATCLGNMEFNWVKKQLLEAIEGSFNRLQLKNRLENFASNSNDIEKYWIEAAVMDILRSDD